jgi:hypothetical protein
MTPHVIKKKKRQFMGPAKVRVRPVSGDKIKEIQIELAKTDF